MHSDGAVTKKKKKKKIEDAVICVITFLFKIIDPLPPIDHSDIDYEPFERNFYQEHEEIKALTNDQVDELRRTLGIRVGWAGFLCVCVCVCVCVHV